MVSNFLVLSLLGASVGVKALENGVAKLPILGYNTWNYFQCDIDEDLMVTTAELMRDLGLQAVGYNYVNIDDCYSERNRTAKGFIIEDQVRFKTGMRNLTDYLHQLGFKAGIYSDAGWFTCAGYPGSWGNEERDAYTFFEDWGFDYLKYDNCAIPFDRITRTGIIGRYQRMADALAALKREVPIVFSLCEWGWSQVWLWGKKLGHSWRTTGDIAPTWNSLTDIIDFNAFLVASTDFYGRNDLDMLQLGNGDLTYEESKSHFTAWALMKSPLLIGTDLTKITNETLEILTNKEILAINQDDQVGKGISPFRWGINPDYIRNATHPPQYWSGPVKNDQVVFMALNTLDEPSTLFFNLTESPWIRAGKVYSVRDLWKHETAPTPALRNITLEDVPAHGVVALLLTDAGDEPEGVYPECGVWDHCTAEDGTRVDV